MKDKISMNLETYTRWAKFNEWNRQWNKIMSGVFCALVFGLSLIIVMTNSTSANTPEDNVNSHYRRPMQSADNKPNKCTIIMNRCEIYCLEIEQNLSATVEPIILNDVNCTISGYHLNLESPKLTVISPGWFQSSARIIKVTIQDNGKIIQIEPGAFNDCTFRSVVELQFRGMGIILLKRGVFDGLNNLKSLFLYQNNKLKQIEESTFDPLYQLEQFEMVEHKALEDLTNVTGKTEWKNLQSLSLNKNSFRSNIKKPTFKGCTKVKILNLSNSAIESIGPYSFDPMADIIEILDLSKNLLKSLPSQLLANMIRPNMELYLSGNLWNCDCNCLELKGYDTNNSSLIFDSPLICDAPKPQQGIEMRNVLHHECLASTTSATPTTESSTRETSLKPPNYSSQLKCIDSGVIHLETEYQYFNIKEEDMGTVAIEINNPDQSLAMVHINDYDYGAKCQYDLRRKIFFTDLNPRSSHLFCLIKKTTADTSPKNCLPFHFHDNQSIWNIVIVRITLAGSSLFALTVGVLFGWLLSSRYQHRSKRDLNKAITSDLNYIRRRVSLDYYDARPYSRRRYSENSLPSCNHYEIAITPSAFEMKQRQNAMNSNVYHLSDNFDKLQYDLLPPPLPPLPNRPNIKTAIDPEIAPYRIT